MEIQLSNEQLNEIVNQVRRELKEDRKNFRIRQLTEIEHKYHWQLIKISNGQTWDTIRKMAALLLGYRLVRNVPVEKYDELCRITEDLCKRVINAWENKK